jgi:hypothetical protein
MLRLERDRRAAHRAVDGVTFVPIGIEPVDW